LENRRLDTATVESLQALRAYVADARGRASSAATGESETLDIIRAFAAIEDPAARQNVLRLAQHFACIDGSEPKRLEP
jgi:hypothetical protein